MELETRIHTPEIIQPLTSYYVVNGSYVRVFLYGALRIGSALEPGWLNQPTNTFVEIHPHMDD